MHQFGRFCADTKVLRFPEILLAIPGSVRFDDRAARNGSNF
jgi:hypothetical protein